MVNTFSKLIRLESWLFFIGWIIIFLLGSDFPPPIGFYQVVLLTALLALVQRQYLMFLLPRLVQSGFFIANTGLFLAVGLLLGLITGLLGGYESVSQWAIWLGFIVSVSTIYGMLFWLVNQWLVNRNRNRIDKDRF